MPLEWTLDSQHVTLLWVKAMPSVYKHGSWSVDTTTILPPPPPDFFSWGILLCFLINTFFYMLQQTSKKYNKIYLLYIFYISLNCIFFSLLPLSVKFPLPIFFSKLMNWGSKFIRLKFILNRCLYAYNMNINIQGLNSWIPYKSQNLKTYILTFHDSSIV